ncbi:MAG: flagellar basal-body rod modification protein FlgD [Saliniramus fredricksonii]|uniref:Basal-body rod modification protein FlgD n=1 Tax=Saliniramus fredricksonii TaxID=1653334 RepID=A0A0P8A164_9HYPH|nr:flagellar hook assembly protein FlgD [Saliniramus fredricksonii]KPQ08896.1 MAG: flagellar basal-body rod modification protein FlgD [Saliniramus fredricksonii]SCC79114.1 flagellar basal-body rod modification protein FlgD [Saliniramus fredricksonii]
MMVNPTQAPPGGAESQTGAGQVQERSTDMDYDAFLRLLIAEMKHQDPLDPTDASEYVSQFASFSVVEQAIQTNRKLDDLLAGLSLSQSGGLIGRHVTSGDGSVSGEIESVRLTDQGPHATLSDGRSLLVGPGVTITGAPS